MSLVVSNIKMPINSPVEDIAAEALKIIKASNSMLASYDLHKVSYDLRHNNLSCVYSIELSLNVDEEAFVNALDMPNVRMRSKAAMPQITGKERLKSSPVIIGFGPAGLFAALILAKNGYKPIVFERGGSIEERDLKVDCFFEGGDLDLSSNVQFGEGGAGTYSDGKLTTRINDPKGQLVLDLFGEYGAEREMLIKAKPHIGTDKLKCIVRSMRNDIIRLGGIINFNSPVSDFSVKNAKLNSINLKDGGEVKADVAILATGHSARDIFELMANKQISIEAKPFSVGVRAEHLQENINYALYGKHIDTPGLPVGEYNLSRRSGDRACYTFCMCPGGYVVASASEENSIVTNGMSFHDRSGVNANSAICVSVSPSDFGGTGPLAGMHYQREIERAAFAAVGGKNAAPVQLYGDFAQGRVTKSFGKVQPTYRPETAFADINKILPNYVCDMIKESMPYFGRKMRGFDNADTVFTAPETRTSSPVRILRNEAMFSPEIFGLIPCGEGAGYAGGIVSAAVDGIRAAARIMEIYSPEEII